MEKQLKPLHVSEKKERKVAGNAVKPSQVPASQPNTISTTSLSAHSSTMQPATPSSSPSSESTSPTPPKPAPAKPSKKEEAVARGLNLSISKKHSMYICSFIKNKSVESAIADLEQVLKFKKAVPYKGEIPHRHGMMSGRYPINASKAFISVLKGLKGNIAVSDLAPDKARITFASASWASRPQKKGGARFKRTHIVIKAREVALPVKQEKKK